LAMMQERQLARQSLASPANGFDTKSTYQRRLAGQGGKPLADLWKPPEDHKDSDSDCEAT